MLPLEYYYLFGENIDLAKYKLGRIKQPKINDFVKNNITIEDFYSPFIMNDLMIKQTKKVQETIELKEKLGTLTFLMFNIYNASEERKEELLNSFRNSFYLLYETKEIIFKDYKIFIGSEEDLVIVDNDNFDILCDVVLEMLKINKDNLNVEEKKPMSALDRVFEERRNKYKKKAKKEEGFSILDLCNIVVHGYSLEYEKVYNMTIYQLKNSYEVMLKKEAFHNDTLYRISPKFEFKDNKFEHWVEKAKIEKSNLIKKV